MNWKKLIGFSLLFWVIIFVVWSVIMYVSGMSNMWQWIIGGVADALVAFLLAHWYFGRSADKNFGQGLIFGLVALVVATVLDLLITMPLFMAGDYAGFYGKWELWLSYGIVLVFAGLAGVCRCRWCRMEGEKPMAMEDKK